MLKNRRGRKGLLERQLDESIKNIHVPAGLNRPQVEPLAKKQKLDVEANHNMLGKIINALMSYCHVYGTHTI